jgi:DNA repair protein RadD
MNPTLKNLLSGIPQGRLVNLIGSEVCVALSNYTTSFETGVIDYKNTLLSRYGESLLFNRSVYETIMTWVSPELASTLCEKLHIKFANQDDAVEKLKRINLRREPKEFVKSFASACGLDPEAYSDDADEEPIKAFSVLEPIAPLHDFQKRIKDEVVKHILSAEQNASLLVHMPTGSGKTRTCMEALVDFHRAKSALGGHDFSGFVVWLAHSKELCEQACETFEFLWKHRGDSPLPIFRLYGDADYPEELLNVENAIVFASFQKYNAMRKSTKDLQRKLTSRIPAKTRLVVVDEAHRSLATTYQDAIDNLTSTPGIRLIGLTATPGRSVDLNDPQNDYLSCFFNGSKIGLNGPDGIPIENPIDYLQERQILARIERVELKTHCDLNIGTEDELRHLNERGDDFLSSVASSLASDPSRNHMLISEISEAYRRGEAILVFACNIEHCVILETLLSERGIESASILGSTSKVVRERCIEAFRAKKLRVLLNYGVLSTGFDAPCLNTLIIARPISSIVLYSQIVGRALRGPLNGGNSENKIIDLIDNIKIMGTISTQFSHFDTIWK